MDDGAHIPANQHAVEDAVGDGPFLGIGVFEVEVVQKAEAEEHAPPHQRFEDAALQQVASEKGFLIHALPESP